MKLYSKNELKSSRIFFDKQPPMFFTILIVFILVLLISTIAVCTVLPKNYVVQAQGVITTEDNTYVGTLSDGIVLDIKKKEGTPVKKGDVLFTVSNGAEGVQLKGLLDQQKQVQDKLEAMNVYDKSLKDGVNYLKNSGYEQEYFGKMEYYLSQVSDDDKNASNQKQDIEKKQAKLKSKKDELNTLTTEQAQLSEEVKKNASTQEQSKDEEKPKEEERPDTDGEKKDETLSRGVDSTTKLEEIKTKI